MHRQSEDYLFNKSMVHEVLEYDKGRLSSEIDSLSTNQILDTNPEKMADHFESKFKVQVPTLDKAGIVISETEIKIAISPQFEGFNHSGGTQSKVPGIRITYHVPFSGDAEVFKVQPSTHFVSPLRGLIINSELQIHYEERSVDSERMKRAFTSDLANIETHLRQLSSDVAGFNGNLWQFALDRINGRRVKLIKDQKAVTELGFPLKERARAKETFAYPAKMVQIPMPSPAKVAGAAPEPVLDMQIYESVLSTLQNMALVIERSPNSFKSLDEESLRHHFLVHLNGHFEGNATGETFNAEGKTDILIRVEGKTIFIAECKFWGGPKTLTDAIDQILSYTTWRDTKVAILVFNRAKDFSKVVGQFSSVVQGHKAFVKKVAYPSETGYRAIMQNKNDPSRELTLTILGFDVPTGD